MSPVRYRRGLPIFLLTNRGSSWLACQRAFLSGSLLELFCRSSEVSVLFVPWFFSPYCQVACSSILSTNCCLASLRPKINSDYHY